MSIISKIIKINKFKLFIRNKLGSDFHELLNHGKNYITADIFMKGLSFIRVPIFTRLLAPEAYGILAVFGSFINISRTTIDLGVSSGLVRYYYEKNDDFDEYLGSNLIFLLSWGLIFSLILFALQDQLIKFFQIPVGMIYIGIGIVYLSITFQLLSVYFQASKQSKRISSLTVVNGILTLIISVTITVLLTKNRYYGPATAQLIIYLLFFGYSAYHLIKMCQIAFKIKYIKYSLIIGIPIVFHLLSQYILNNFDQVIINQLVGKKETGLYSFAYNVGFLQNLISIGILRAWTPIFYEKLNDKKFLDIEKLAKNYSKIVYILALGLILFSEELVMLLADQKYWPSIRIVPLIVLGYVFFFLYTMYVNYAFYKKKTYLIAVITIIAGTINVGLNYWLIPIYGYTVAAWTTLLSYACLFILNYLNVKFIIKMDDLIRLRALVPNFAKILLIIIGFYLMKDLISNYFYLFVIKVITLLLGVSVLYVKEVKKMVR